MEPLDWLEEFDILLEGEAACWGDDDPVIREIMSDAGMLRAGQREVMTVQEHFLERFCKPEEVPRNPIPEIQPMKQG